MRRLIAEYRAPAAIQIAPWCRVLLVDDDRADLEYHGGVLQSQGHQVTTCSSYEEAVTLLDNTVFDLAIVSQGSPRFEGRNVLEHAAADGRRIPILVVAARTDMNCYLEAMRLGAADYFEKPLSPAEMRRAIGTCLSNG